MSDGSTNKGFDLPAPLLELDRRIASAVEDQLSGIREQVEERLRTSGNALLKAAAELHIEAPSHFLNEADVATFTAPAAAQGAGSEALLTAAARIDRARTQPDLLSVLLEEARRVSARSAFFLTRPDGAHGWSSRGFGDLENPLEDVVFSYEGDESWSSLVQGHGPVLLGRKRCAAVAERLGTDMARQGALIPFVLRGHLAGALYADVLPSDDKPLDMAALQLLVHLAALSLETLALRQDAGSPTLRGASADRDTSADGMGLWDPPSDGAVAATTATAAATAAALAGVDAQLDAHVDAQLEAQAEPDDDRPTDEAAAVEEPAAPVAEAPTDDAAADGFDDGRVQEDRVDEDRVDEDGVDEDGVDEDGAHADRVQEDRAGEDSIDGDRGDDVETTDDGSAEGRSDADDRASDDVALADDLVFADSEQSQTAELDTSDSLPDADDPETFELDADEAAMFETDFTPDAPDGVAVDTAIVDEPKPVTTTDSGFGDDLSLATDDADAEAKVEDLSDTRPGLHAPEPTEAEPTANLEAWEDEDPTVETRFQSSSMHTPEPAPSAPAVNLDDTRATETPEFELDYSGTQAPAPQPKAEPVRFDPNEDATIVASRGAMITPPEDQTPAEPEPSESMASDAPSLVTPPSTDAKPAARTSSEVVPPVDIDGPGSAFGGVPSPSQSAVPEGEEALHEEAKRLARLLVSEIKLYNEEVIDEGRREGNIYARLREDIDRSRQMYDERIDPRLREGTDYFVEELVQRLAGGDASVMGL